MRLLAIIVLTSLMMLTVLPQISAAEPATHDCAYCAEMMTFTDQQAPANHHQADATCADMVTCASHALLDTSQLFRDSELLPLDHAWPEPRNGTTISLSSDLPPPRA